jgi:pimeloyl-ACP methyl ester carboxylesterase
MAELPRHSRSEEYLALAHGLPTLVIGGRVSLIPWKSLAWIAKQIPGAQLEIFEENEGGSHFMFVENPTKFNQIVSKFVA